MAGGSWLVSRAGGAVSDGLYLSLAAASLSLASVNGSRPQVHAHLAPVCLDPIVLRLQSVRSAVKELLVPLE